MTYRKSQILTATSSKGLYNKGSLKVSKIATSPPPTLGHNFCFAPPNTEQ